MNSERPYIVVSAEVIREHGVIVQAKTRWEAWQAARDAEPAFKGQRVVITPVARGLEVGGEKWLKP